ncbi:MAG: hypothetical protein ACREP6_16360, partial [Candidatus Binataceae bacterium]
ALSLAHPVRLRYRHFPRPIIMNSNSPGLITGPSSPSLDAPGDHQGKGHSSIRRLSLGSLICVMYLTVSGGAYGIEDAVRIAGPRLALLLCLLCCIVFTLLVPLGFVTLVIFDVFFYMGALMLEMGALVRLRWPHPNREGLFVIGGGRLALAAVVIAPLFIWSATFGLALSESSGHTDFLIAIILTIAVWPIYLLCRRFYGGPQLAAAPMPESQAPT